MSSKKDDDLVPSKTNGVSLSNNHEVLNPDAADLDSRAAGTSAENTLPGNESGVTNHGVPNPNAASDRLAPTEYQLTVRRSALYLCAEAFRGEASTMLDARTQGIRLLMRRWNIPHISLDSPPLVPNEQQSDGGANVARRSSQSNTQADFVPPKSQRDGGDNVARRRSQSNIQADFVPPKPQIDGGDNIARRSSQSNIQADLVPPKSQRVRKRVERYSSIEQLTFTCMCGQRFSAQSNLTTHKKKCVATKEEFDEEEDIEWTQKKRRSGGQ